MRPRDTSPEAWKVLMDLMRKMSPEEKLQRTLELSSAMRLAREAGLREAYPQAGDREIFLRLARETLGVELYRKVYGEGLPPDGSVQPDSVSDHRRI
jgi:hypothetical protein